MLAKAWHRLGKAHLVVSVRYAEHPSANELLAECCRFWRVWRLRMPSEVQDNAELLDSPGWIHWHPCPARRRLGEDDLEIAFAPADGVDRGIERRLGQWLLVLVLPDLDTFFLAGCVAARD